MENSTLQLVPRQSVTNCYNFLDMLFSESNIHDYTDGMYFGNPATPYEIAQHNQLNYLLNQIGCGAGSKILDIGCGAGTLLEEARKRGASGVGITLSPAQAKRCQAKGLDVQVMNYRDIPQSWNHQFDGIIANGSGEHFVQPQDAIEGKQDAIYQELFQICHRLLNPRSSSRRFATTMIHFKQKIEPKLLLKNPLVLPWGSEEFHCALLHRSLAGYYPSIGQLATCASPLFTLTAEVEGTHDYYLTSEEWLKRCIRTIVGNRSLSIGKKMLSWLLKAPTQLFFGLLCLFMFQSWNWQFRSKNGSPPPMQLLRHTWQAV